MDDMVVENVDNLTSEDGIVKERQENQTVYELIQEEPEVTWE